MRDQKKADSTQKVVRRAARRRIVSPINKTAELLLAAPMVEWSAITEKHSATELCSVAVDLDAICERAARAAAYCCGRGCGDLGHLRAVKMQNITAKRIRRVLGYSQPTNNITF